MLTRTHIAGVSIVVVLLLLSSVSIASVPQWMTRPGTIGHALQQPNGTHVYLDAVQVDKNKPYDNPEYFVIGECFDRDSRIIVTSPLPQGFRLGQTVDVEGTLTTLDNGYRAIADATIYAYLDKEGNMLYHGPLVKGLLAPIPWQWKQAFPPATGSQTISSITDGLPGEDPNPSPLDGATYYATIAEAKAQPDGTFLELQCKPIQSTSTGYFIMAEDGTTDTLKVYYSKAVSTTDRVSRVVGTMKTDSGQRVLCVDSGPGFNPAVDQTGSATIAASGTIAWAKTFPNGTWLPTDGRAHALELKPATWCDGYNVYIEEANRSSGVLLSTGNLPPSDDPYLTDVDGMVCKPGDGSETYILASATYTPTTDSPRPVGMNNRSLSQGLAPSGLLVRIWGKVTAVNEIDGYIYIDDGSGLSDGTQTDGVDNIGIRVPYSDDYYPAVGDFAVVNGPHAQELDYGTFTYVKCIRSRGHLDATLFPPPAPTGFAASAGNGVVLLFWDEMNAAKFNVYRSTSQLGTYTYIGYSVTTSYSDSSVTNGTTYWYKVAAVNGNSEGPQAGPADATPSASAPTVSINNASIDTNGLLTLQCSGTCSEGEPIYALTVDEDLVWFFTQAEIADIVYDTTQLSNGSHKFELTASYGDYYAVASQIMSIQNFISEFNVPDDMCGMQPISAKFQTTTNWTLTVTQGGSTLYSTSGSGTAMEVSWDAGYTYGEFNVTLAAAGKSRTVKSRKDNSSSGGDYYAWSSIYVEDKDDVIEGNFQYMHSFAVDALQSKYGASLWSGRISSDNAWQDVVIDDILNNDEVRANIFVFAGHGTAGIKSEKNPVWQGLIKGIFSSSGYTQGSGLTAFININPFFRNTGYFIPVGPAIGNTIEWDPQTGRFSNWNCNRRFRFVFLGACEAGQGAMSLAFGTPRERSTGRGRAFLSFKTTVPGGYMQMFSEKFWAEWKKSGVTVSEAATRAFWRLMDGKKYRTEYVLHGDPNLLIK